MEDPTKNYILSLGPRNDDTGLIKCFKKWNIFNFCETTTATTDEISLYDRSLKMEEKSNIYRYISIKYTIPPSTEAFTPFAMTRRAKHTIFVYFHDGIVNDINTDIHNMLSISKNCRLNVLCPVYAPGDKDRTSQKWLNQSVQRLFKHYMKNKKTSKIVLMGKGSGSAPACRMAYLMHKYHRPPLDLILEDPPLMSRTGSQPRLCLDRFLNSEYYDLYRLIGCSFPIDIFVPNTHEHKISEIQNFLPTYNNSYLHIMHHDTESDDMPFNKIIQTHLKAACS